MEGGKVLIKVDYRLDCQGRGVIPVKKSRFRMPSWRILLFARNAWKNWEAASAAMGRTWR
jgi:hypothetical protein